MLYDSSPDSGNTAWFTVIEDNRTKIMDIRMGGYLTTSNSQWVVSFRRHADKIEVTAKEQKPSLCNSRKTNNFEITFNIPARYQGPIFKEPEDGLSALQTTFVREMEQALVHIGNTVIKGAVIDFLNDVEDAVWLSSLDKNSSV